MGAKPDPTPSVESVEGHQSTVTVRLPYRVRQDIDLVKSGTLCSECVSAFIGALPIAASVSSLLPGSLAIRRTRLIGREIEQGLARHLLLDEAVPLLTLTGPGMVIGLGVVLASIALVGDVHLGTLAPQWDVKRVSAAL